MKKCCQSIIRNFHAAITTQLRLSAGKHNSILHAPAAARNLDEAIPLRSAETELQITIELHTTAILHKLQLQNRISTLKRKNGDFVTFSKKWKGKPSAPKCCQSTIRNFHATTKIRFTNFKIGTCKSQSESQDSIYTEEQVPFEQPGAQPFHCWIPQHNRLATRYCRTHRFDARVPMHKVSQNMIPR